MRFLAALGMTLITACTPPGPAIKHQVMTPPPSAPRAEFFVERPDVRSREVGEEAWRRNEQYAGALYDVLLALLVDRGKAIVAPPATTVRARAYLGYGPGPVRSKESRRAKAHVEVRLQLLDAASGAVVYSTLSQAPLAKGLDESEADAMIREVLEQAARDFVSRL
jgi:hypothetical protein